MLKEQKILFLGAGSAGIGIANMIASAMQLEGLNKDEALNNISLFDINGLLENSRTDLSEEQKIYAHEQKPTRNLVDAIEEIKPTVLIGVSTIGKAFNQRVIETMAKFNEQPIIFALSNPTEHAECTATEAYRWSNGKAIYAAGVPFDPVQFNNKTFVPGQANNYYLFPGVSLAIYAARPKLVTDELWIESAKALAGLVTDEQRARGMVFPPQSDILELSTKIAVHVSDVIFKRKLTDLEQPVDMESWVRNMQYKPEYSPVEKSLSIMSML